MRSWSGLKLDDIMILRVILLPVKSCQSDAVNYICRDIVEDQRLGGGLQGEVGDQGVVGEDLHLEPGEVAVQVLHSGRDPGHQRTRNIHQLKLHVRRSYIGNCYGREE